MSCYLDYTLWIPDSRFQVPDFRFFVNGYWNRTSIVDGISGFLSCIPPCSLRSPIFGAVSLLCQLFSSGEPGPRLRIPDSLRKTKIMESGFPLTCRSDRLSYCIFLISMIDTGSKTETKQNVKSFVGHGKK